MGWSSKWWGCGSGWWGWGVWGVKVIWRNVDWDRWWSSISLIHRCWIQVLGHLGSSWAVLWDFVGLGETFRYGSTQCWRCWHLFWSFCLGPLTLVKPVPWKLLREGGPRGGEGRGEAHVGLWHLGQDSDETAQGGGHPWISHEWGVP